MVFDDGRNLTEGERFPIHEDCIAFVVLQWDQFEFGGGLDRLLVEHLETLIERVDESAGTWLRRLEEAQWRDFKCIARRADDLAQRHVLLGESSWIHQYLQLSLSLAEGEISTDLVRSLMARPEEEAGGPEALDLSAVERRHIGRVLKMAGGNKTRAAKLLGLDRRTLQRKGF